MPRESKKKKKMNVIVRIEETRGENGRFVSLIAGKSQENHSFYFSV